MPDVASSILAVDFGNVHTRAVLIDLVDGVYSLVAQVEEPATIGFPIHNVAVSLGRAARQLGVKTGRRLLTPDGRILTPEQPDRSGVDSFLATASIGRPLRTVLLGLVPGLSVASGMRAAAGTYIDVLDVISLDDTRTREAQLNAIVMARPDLLFIVGGTERGARTPVLELAGLAKTAARLMRGAPPFVLYAGNSRLVQRIESMFEGVADVFIADNVRPSLEDEALDLAQLQLAMAFDAFSNARGQGFEQVSGMTRLGVLPNAQSYHLIADYLGKTGNGKAGGGVLIADIGSAVSTLSASVNGKVTTSIRTDIGLGHSAGTMMDVLGTVAVERWLPFATDHAEITNYALNKTLRPAHVPESVRGLYLEHALLRAALGGLLAASRPAWTEAAFDDPQAPMPPLNRIIGAGAALANTGRPGMTAMLLLDALQPVGVAQLQIDGGGLLTALGALARLNPQATVQLLDASGVEDLCTSISLSGQPRAGRTAAVVRVVLADGTMERHTVKGGELWVYPLSIGVRASVTVAAGGGLNIGGKRRVKVEVEGGTAGLVIDARGRPLPLARTAQKLAEQIPNWYAQATGDAARAAGTGWLDEALAEDARARRRRPSRETEAAAATIAQDIADPDMTPKKQSRSRIRRGKVRGSETPDAVGLYTNDLVLPPVNTPKSLEDAPKLGRRPTRKRDEDDIDDLRSLLP